MGLETIALIGLGIGIIGAGVQFVGQKKIAKASKKANAARKQMAHLESLRERRKNIKLALAARADTVSNASSQGALASSSATGSLFQTTSALGRANVASRQNAELSNKVFSAHDDEAAGGLLASFGTGLQNAGQSLFNISSSPFFNKPVNT